MGLIREFKEFAVKDSYDNAPAPGRRNNDVSITGALAIKLWD